MIGILLISHGKMAEGIKDSINLIVGNVDSIETIGFHAGQDIESLKEKVQKAVKRLDNGAGVLVYVDLFGASPYNAAMFSYPELKEVGIEIKVISGLNLPMILEVVFMRENMTLDEISKISIESGKRGIVEGIETLEKITDEDGDY